MMLKINPNKTPNDISLEEIREINRTECSKVRFFQIETRKFTTTIIALPTVYYTDKFGDTKYFAKEMQNLVYGRFLEIGSGTGAVIIHCLLSKLIEGIKIDKKWMAVDLNPIAVKNTKINALINGVEKNIEIFKSDIFSNVINNKFDCIFWNHPFHKGNRNEEITSRSCFDPNYEGFKKFISQCHNYINIGGKVFLGSSNFSDLHIMRNILSEYRKKMDLKKYVPMPFKATNGKFKTFNIYEIKNR